MSQPMLISQDTNTLEIVPSSSPVEIESPPPNNPFTLPFLLLIALLVGGGFWWFVQTCLCICKPNEVVILTGRKQRTKSGKIVGYRVLSQGMALHIPIIETVKRMDISNMPLRVAVKNAYAKGGTPINVQAIANIKISSDLGVVNNAIERFLDRDRSEIVRVATETLEGYLRGVIATLTPEQVNEDRLKFAELIANDVSSDLKKLGIEIDTFKVQNVSDSVDYLNSLSRESIALVIKSAEIAESNAISEAEQVEAESEELAKVAQTQDQITVLEKENELRKIKAKLDQSAKIEEEITIAAAKEKRAKIEQKLQEVRAELERLRLQADEVLPAEAQKEAAYLKAQGEAAYLAENAKAEALVNQMLSQVWQETNSAASEIFLLEQIEAVLKESTQIPKRLKLKRINVVDNGNGQSISSLINVYPDIVIKFLESVHSTLGIDVVGTLTQLESEKNKTENSLDNHSSLTPLS